MKSVSRDSRGIGGVLALDQEATLRSVAKQKVGTQGASHASNPGADPAVGGFNTALAPNARCLEPQVPNFPSRHRHPIGGTATDCSGYRPDRRRLGPATT